jgi:hypothetical protein
MALVAGDGSRHRIDPHPGNDQGKYGKHHLYKHHPASNRTGIGFIF